MRRLKIFILIACLTSTACADDRTHGFQLGGAAFLTGTSVLTTYILKLLHAHYLTKLHRTRALLELAELMEPENDNKILQQMLKNKKTSIKDLVKLKNSLAIKKTIFKVLKIGSTVATIGMATIFVCFKEFYTPRGIGPYMYKSLEGEV